MKVLVLYYISHVLQEQSSFRNQEWPGLFVVGSRFVLWQVISCLSVNELPHSQLPGKMNNTGVNLKEKISYVLLTNVLSQCRIHISFHDDIFLPNVTVGQRF